MQGWKLIVYTDNNVPNIYLIIKSKRVRSECMQSWLGLHVQMQIKYIDALWFGWHDTDIKLRIVVIMEGKSTHYSVSKHILNL